MAKPSPEPAAPRLLVVELWGLGDVALAIPFLRSAARHARVTLLAKPHARQLLARFAPEVDPVPLIAPWTAFRGKYRLHRWPWRELARVRRTLREAHFDFGVSARRDPRDHVLLALAGVRARLGFASAGSHFFLSRALPPPERPHRAEHWAALSRELGWQIESRPAKTPARNSRRVVVHTGAGQPARRWPRERFDLLAARLGVAGWHVTVLDDSTKDLDSLLTALATADRFIGNDSGPGHLAALLGVPTFTIFGPQLPELFAPQHPQAAWIDGAPCLHKPCFDYCRFTEPHCLLSLEIDEVWPRVQAWLESPP